MNPSLHRQTTAAHGAASVLRVDRLLLVAVPLSDWLDGPSSLIDRSLEEEPTWEDAEWR